ncbi:hypothetical protein PFICI_08251 [Pestalotiopsis fici W106-1]|uniref:FAD-binding PCMH-type domain-containing protein n=1 Tax=Pestalotiopsis fici (strain W106-1 / CGMCC3.15140) TaxID=1229662 RepID=W3X5T0_PESFW|nr:uncharacterized protein PFICI_08251 [Pestalotiopsis fici W106-1]ETS80722.1 hypothetical protein PFICI_08251 [Pestalotiopsis fici W106-1]
MATLNELKKALWLKADSITPLPRQVLSEYQYATGFELLARDPEWATDESFMAQLSQLLGPLFGSRTGISVLEIGPGPKSVLGHLSQEMRSRIKRYTAFEPNTLHATRLEAWLSDCRGGECPLPRLRSEPIIHRAPFEMGRHAESSTPPHEDDQDQGFDLVLFCHSMYGMNPKRSFVERALELLAHDAPGGLVVIIHREATLHLDGLVCYRTISLPSGCVYVENDDVSLDSFSAFIAGFAIEDAAADKNVRDHWRIVCRTLGRLDKDHLNHLKFSAPQEIVAFTRDSTSLEFLKSEGLVFQEQKTVKNRDARLHSPAAIVRPTGIRQLQHCVEWALDHQVGLTIIGGGHSGQCLWSNVVAIDMGAFDQVHILEEPGEEEGANGPLPLDHLIIAEAGCNTGDVIRKSMASGLTVPLGARPSVGAGLWLQGGIGHLSRIHGLTCDAIIGAVLVSVDSGQVLHVGHVPRAYRPAGSVRPDNEADLLWAIKGAGTNFGVVTSVTLKAQPARNFLVRNWKVPVPNMANPVVFLADFDKQIAQKLGRDSSVDAYIFGDEGMLLVGVTLYQSFLAGSETPDHIDLEKVLGPEECVKIVDSVDVFDTEMYISGMHGGHGGGKTSSFKRCAFIRNIGAAKVANVVMSAIQTRPSPLCYIHLLQGGGAVSDVAATSTAFGCRDWDFACVITGVWPREQDGTVISRSIKQWVYNVATSLSSLSSGFYGADLGPDPRDLELANKAFGPNRPRLAHLKENCDPCNVLAYACPLPKLPIGPKLVILVTGDSGAGKDYCAEIWVAFLNQCVHVNLKCASVSISNKIKRQYAAATGADLDRLLGDRIYKEQHRPALTAFFQGQVRKRPGLPVENFLSAVHNAGNVDVLLITGMRDAAPVTTLSHLVPHTRLLDIRVEASTKTRILRRSFDSHNTDTGIEDGNLCKSDSITVDYQPSLTFHNETSGSEAAEHFAQHILLQFLDEDLGKLAKMVRSVPNYPRPGIEFRHILGIVEQPGGLDLCASLLEAQYASEWSQVDRIACCEAGGFLIASALATRTKVPLLLMREASKLPPPILSVVKSASYISSSSRVKSRDQRIGMDRDASSNCKSVVVVDDVLATGKTLCAMMKLLEESGLGLDAADITILVVAEFPIHRGRELLRRHGFGNVRIQSLLVFGGS